MPFGFSQIRRIELGRSVIVVDQEGKRDRRRSAIGQENDDGGTGEEEAGDD